LQPEEVAIVQEPTDHALGDLTRALPIKLMAGHEVEPLIKPEHCSLHLGNNQGRGFDHYRTGETALAMTIFQPEQSHVPYLASGRQAGRASRCPKVTLPFKERPGALHRIRGPNDGRATSSGQASMLVAAMQAGDEQPTHAVATHVPSVMGRNRLVGYAHDLPTTLSGCPIDPHPVQLTQIAVVEQPAQHIHRDLTCTRLWSSWCPDAISRPRSIS